MSQQPDIVTIGELDLAERDFVFQSLLIRKNQTYKYLLIIKKEINIGEYQNQRWFRQPWEQVTVAKKAIVEVISKPNVSVQWRGADYKFTELEKKFNHDLDSKFDCYLDSFIGNLSEEELHQLESHHININHHLYTLIGAVEYDRASRGA